MPIYEYGCQQCGYDFEEMQKFTDPPLEHCPECGNLTAQRKVSVSAFHLKGGGWYKDGYGSKAELESDSQGMMNSVEAGYHPFAMVSFLKNLRNQEMMSGQAYHGFQASHPETKERIVKAGAFASSLSQKYTTSIGNHNEYIQKLKGLVYGGKRHLKDKRKYKSKYLDVYEVRKGDTLQSISNKIYKDDRHAYEIAVINGIKENVTPNPGFMLKIISDGVYILDKSISLKPDLVN